MQEEINDHNLITDCFAINIEKKIAYIPIYSSLYDQGQRLTAFYLSIIDIQSQTILISLKKQNSI